MNELIEEVVKMTDKYEPDKDCPFCQGKGKEEGYRWVGRKYVYSKDIVPCECCHGNFDNIYKKAKELINRYSGNTNFTRQFKTGKQIDKACLSEDGQLYMRLLKWIWDNTDKEGSKIPVKLDERYRRKPPKISIAREHKLMRMAGNLDCRSHNRLHPTCYDASMPVQNFKDCIKSMVKVNGRIPILNCTKIDFYANMAYFESTDLDDWYYSESDAEVLKDSTWIVPTKVLVRILQQFNEGHVYFYDVELPEDEHGNYAKQSILKLKIGSTEYKLLGFDENNWPYKNVDNNVDFGWQLQ